MSKVSVIIPVYGVEKYIERCARSLFEQTLDDIEYLFIDDCSPDNSMEILESVLKDYPHRRSQIVVHRMEKNSGQAKVREWGLRNAKGDFVIHCDSDDWLEKDAYQLMYEKAIIDNSDVVICDYFISDGNSYHEEIKGCGTTNKQLLIKRLLSQIDSWALWNKLFRRSVCCTDRMKYPDGNMGEDMVICIQMIMSSNKISYINKSLYNYFYNSSSITHIDSDKKKMNNFYQNKENIHVLENIIRVYGMEKMYSVEMALVKWRVKKILWHTCFDSDKYIIWRDSFPEINKKILLIKHIPVKEKIRFVLLSNKFGFYLYGLFFPKSKLLK